MKNNNPRFEVADIFRIYGDQFRQNIKLPVAQLKVMRHIEICRTAELGGHVEQCSDCGFERISYNSCRDRHCPKCQTLAKEKWLNDRKSELLPTAYFHIVFTLPHELNPLILKNKSVMLTILFKAVAATLLTFGENKLGGKLGFVAVLHTWD